MDKGLIFKPDSSHGLECFMDVDFAGGWASGDYSNPEAVLSQTGFVIYLRDAQLLGAGLNILLYLRQRKK